MSKSGKRGAIACSMVLWIFCILIMSHLWGIVGAVASTGAGIIVTLSNMIDVLIDLGDKIDEHEEEGS